jgi:hypothetical protein
MEARSRRYRGRLLSASCRTVMSNADMTGPGRRQRIPEPALFLCRTPFQAMIIDRILKSEGIKVYDLIYYNRNITAKDDDYFKRIAAGARSGLLLNASSVSGWRKFLSISSRRHASVFIANHTFSIFRALVARKARASLYSFDEGAGNFHKKGALHVDHRTAFERMRDRLMAAPAVADIFRRVVAHYTVDPRLDNVVPAERLRDVGVRMPGHPVAHADFINLIIGQPFAEYLSPAEVEAMHEAFRQVPNALYVPHPREARAGIPAGFTLLEDARIIEEVVLSFLSAGKAVRLIGGFSTAFATIYGSGIDKYFVEVSHDPELARVMSEWGCTICNVGTPEAREDWKRLTAGWAVGSAETRSRSS